MLFKLLCTVYQCTLFQMQCSASETTIYIYTYNGLYTVYIYIYIYIYIYMFFIDFKSSKQRPTFQCVTPIHDSINCHRIKLPPAIHLFSHCLSCCTWKYITLQTCNGLYWSKHTEISIRTSNSHVYWSMRSCATNLRWLLSNTPSEISHQSQTKPTKTSTGCYEKAWVLWGLGACEKQTDHLHDWGS